MSKKRLINEPSGAMREYTRVTLRLSKQLAADVNKYLIPELPNIMAMRQKELHGDSAQDLLDQIMTLLGTLANRHVAEVLAKLPGIASLINRHNQREFAAVVKSNLGVTLPSVMVGAPQSLIAGASAFRSEPFLIPLTDAWLKTNTDLIKSLPTRLHPEIYGIVDRGTTSGKSVRDIAKEIKARYDVTDYRAKLIAQDQTLKLNANLSQYRLKSVGVESYIWRNVGDSRVRPDHVEHEGNVYTWDAPPFDGPPGTAVRCRCRAEAVWPDGS